MVELVKFERVRGESEEGVGEGEEGRGRGREMAFDETEVFFGDELGGEEMSELCGFFFVFGKQYQS